ncbi:MAG TPA: DUF6054 family protein [Feifaniaceae bacterium]|nr:DUF6054 family protein [Feifaniaceae bacterium]
MAGTFLVSLSAGQAMDVINQAVLQSVTGELIDWYEIAPTSGGSCIVAVFEKHFLRAGNRLTLTVVVDDFLGHSRVHTTGGGGGEGLTRFDWGASQSFEGAVERALRPYLTGR